MITSNRCWLKDTCKKYNDLSKECDCRYNDTFCIKLFKLDILYEKSLLTENQRKRVKFVLDANKSDREEYIKLQEIENNIEEFVSEGNNLYIHSYITGNGKTAW